MFNAIVRVFFNLGVCLILLGIIAIGSISYIYIQIKSTIPNSDFLESYQAPEITRVYDRNFHLLHEFAPVNRVNIKFSDIPVNVIAAFLVAEDKNFYYHSGIDPFRIIRALFQNIALQKSPKNLVGASTITQQVAKNFLVGSQKSLLRKFREAFATIVIENKLSKDHILELYLNQIYLGNGSYGIQSASLKYFNKSVEKLSIAEASLLAALPKAPGTLSKNIKKLKSRRDSIIEALLEQGYINYKEATNAINESINLYKEDVAFENYNYYLTPLRDAIAAEQPQLNFTAGIEIFSCMDVSFQKAAQESLREGLLKFDNLASDSSVNDSERTEEISGAIVVMEAGTGKVLAMSGGKNTNLCAFNCAIQANRQIGSCFKPFVYLAALEQGVSTGSIIDDEPIVMLLNNGKEVYIPKNVNNRIHGAVSVKDSFANSYNLASIQLAIDIGFDHVRDTAELFGVYDSTPKHPSMILGACETTLLKLTTAYAMIFNGGFYIKPRFFNAYTQRKSSCINNNTINCQIENGKKHNTVPLTTVSSKNRIASTQAIFGILELLRSVITLGTGKSLLPLEKKLGVKFRGKTGTTNNNFDAWFVGSVSIPGTIYQDNNPLVIGVFVGFLKPKSLGKGNGGASIAMPIFGNFIKNILSDSLVRVESF